MLKACIVGTGPSGMYSAKYLLRALPSLNRVDLIDRLPTPYGLVRFGVAPDHPEVKTVQHDFAEVMSDAKVRFFGNVTVGKDVLIKELKQRYDAVILATGADHDRTLGLPNESKFISGAREFVAWYNGHPDVTDETDALFRQKLQESDSCVIIGNGNVALDCARVLVSSVATLKTTDIANRALDAFQHSRIRKVSVVGRRGHPQAAFTMKELRELTKMDGVHFEVLKQELDIGGATEASMKEIATQRPTKRMDALLRETLAQSPKPDASRHLMLRFLLSPHSILESNDRLAGIRFQKMTLSGPAGHQQAVGTRDFEDIPCQMALRSVGYKAVPLENDVPFDSRKGIVLTKEGGRIEPGLYAVGWVKRGPTGIIGTNIPDAHETVEIVVKDASSFDANRKNAFNDLESLLKQKHTNYVTWEEYKKIEHAEETRGKESHPPRPRVKFEKIAEMLRVAKS